MFRTASHRGLFLIPSLILAIAEPAWSADWPMWRHDPARSGSSSEELPATLHLEWVLELPVPEPAWPDEDKLEFDHFYASILVGRSLFVSSMTRDKVTCYDTRTAEERWTFYTEGPVRFAPAAWGGRLYVAGDDGYLYCLNAADGSLTWRFRGGPSDRRLLGNGRLVSAWPARGAPVVFDGTVYFAAGIWPFMGVFIHALDAATGRVTWSNSGTGSNFTVQQHNSPAFAGVAPQGYVAATDDYLVVSGGRSVPAVFERRTGKLLHFEIGSRKMGGKGGGGYEVVAGRDFFLNAGSMYQMKDGTFVDSVDGLILAENSIIGKDAEGIRAFHPGWETETKRDRRGRQSQRTVVRKAWSAPLKAEIGRIFIRSGSRIYGSGPRGQVLAVDLPRLDRGARISWETRIPDEPLGMIAGDERLFVSSDHGRIYCFGGRRTEAKMPRSSSEVEFVRRGDDWSALDVGPEPGEDWTEADFDDSAWHAGPAPLGYGSSRVRTTLSYGRSADNKRITYYFRRAFHVDDPAVLDELTLRVLVDDGAVIYVNGNEAGRLFMPGGRVSAATRARKGTDEKTYQELKVPRELLKGGANLLAVEVHQVGPTSSDILFDLEFSGRLRSASTPRLDTARDEWRERARRILEVSGAREGTCLSFGLGTGRLVEELLRQSALHVIVIDRDSESVESFRRRMDRLGFYGSRTTALVAFPLDVELAPYIAELVVAEEARTAGVAESELLARKVFHTLRPFSGTAVFAWTASESARFLRAAAASGLDNATWSERSGLTVLRRTDAPTGSADWTHQYGDASNSVVSRDTVVRAPLGLLWFGGPSNRGVLPRHGHGPTPQVVAGRLIVQGRDMIRATDIYTGRLLWERTLKGVGESYDYTSHEPGANAIGSNYISLRDGVYCVHEGRCLRLDPATGRTMSELVLPGASDAKESRDWGYLGAWGKYLVAGSRWTSFDVPEFVVGDVMELKRREVWTAAYAVRYLRDFEPIAYDEAVKRNALSFLDEDAEFEDEDYAEAPEEDDEDTSSGGLGRRWATAWWREHTEGEHRAFVLANLNKLLLDDKMLEKISARLYFKTGADEYGDKLFKYLDEAPGRKMSDREALILKRHILHRTYGLPDYRSRPAGKKGSTERKGSRKLFALERATGKVLWEHEAVYEMRHNAISLGGGAVYLIDSMSSEEEGFYRRRGKPVNQRASVVAIDIGTGKVRWSNSDRVFGTWLGYSEDYGVLLQAGAHAADRTVDEARRGMVAYRGSSGEILWKNNEKYSGPCLLLGRNVVTQGYGTPGRAFDVLTGEPLTVPHPVSGVATVWKYTRKYGCNTAIGSSHLLTFRSAAAGYYDLLSDGGTGNLGGFRSGCTSNLIPAGGILSAPDLTRTCTCAYQNQTSLALVHMPEAEEWTFSPHASDGHPVKKVGFNFGAPGDRRGPDGTLWLDFPSVGGDSPDLAAEALGAEEPFQYPRYHASHILEGSLGWVGASALEGRGEVIVPLDLPDAFDIPNEVSGGRPLAARHASLSHLTPSAVASRGEVARGLSLRRRARTKALDATIRGYPELATDSVTVEFWTRVDSDHDYVDTRVDGDEKHQGYVIENRKLRVRYFASNSDADNNTRVVTLEADDAIQDHQWVHVAFTYDAKSGTGTLYRGGEVVDVHRGSKGRPLWWDDRTPNTVVAAGANENSRLDELRITRRALAPREFLLHKTVPKVDRDVVGYWRMDRSVGSPPKTYTVRLVFSELSDLRAGQRVFTVQLQGRAYLRDFDIAREAGGARRVVIKEFPGVVVRDFLRIGLHNEGQRKPLLSGVQLIREK